MGRPVTGSSVNVSPVTGRPVVRSPTLSGTVSVPSSFSTSHFHPLLPDPSFSAPQTLAPQGERRDPGPVGEGQTDRTDGGSRSEGKRRTGSDRVLPVRSIGPVSPRSRQGVDTRTGDTTPVDGPVSVEGGPLSSRRPGVSGSSLQVPLRFDRYPSLAQGVS